MLKNKIHTDKTNQKILHLSNGLSDTNNKVIDVMGRIYVKIKFKNFFIYEISFFLSGIYGVRILSNITSNNLLPNNAATVNNIGNRFWEFITVVCYFIISYCAIRMASRIIKLFK